MTVDDLKGRLAALEEQLRERDRELRRLRPILEAIDTGFCVIEVIFDDAGAPIDYAFLETNPAFVAQTGLTDAIGKRIRSLAPSHEAFWFETYGRIALTGRPERFEHRADALGRWYEVCAFRIDEPEQRRVAVLFEDIRERRCAETSLRESEQRFRAFVTASSDVIYRMSPDWSEMRALDGRGVLADAATPTDEWLERYIEPADQPMVLAAIDEAIRSRAVFELEHRVRDAEGRLRWISSRAVPIADDNGALREWIGTATDVTERKASERALLESEARYRSLVQASNQVLYMHDPNWTEMRQLSGGGFLADTETPDPDWFDFYIPKEDQAHVWSVIQKAVEARGVFELEHRVRRADGTIGWTSSRSAPVFGDDGEIVGWFGAASDVTDRREAEERLRENEERLKAGAARMEIMVSELHHRTRNILTVVQALFEQTATGVPTDVRERFNARLGALSRVNSLLSHLEGAQRISFDELIREEVAAIAGENRGNRVSLEGPRGIKLRSSSVQTFALALHELATNAVKHGALARPDGQLRVTWRSTRKSDGNRWLHIEWRETGLVGRPDVRAPARGGGAGRKLIERALPYQLGATVDYDLTADGLVCLISLPTSQEH
ncbi:sensor histidine kinase [Methylopila turkensis]|uniref:sensor histidine kinase n=1 Tax=Methylopila turkensis TaxID=1437816 RepID=UPI0022F2F342|nr:PAS domain S-box protein [Methylopila turkensis]